MNDHKQQLYRMGSILGLIGLVIMVLAGTAVVTQKQLALASTTNAPLADCNDGNFGGTYETDDVTLAGDLYVTSNVLIRNNVTVTLQAGSHITMCDEYRIRVEGDGNLIAMGTPTQPIVFDADDAATKWLAIQFVGDYGNHSVLRHVTLNNGGGNDATADNGAIWVNAFNNALASPTLDHVTINDSGAYGISLSIDAADRTPPSLSNVTINNSANAAIIADAQAIGGLGSGNVYTNNTPNHILIRAGGGSRLYHSQRWRNQGVPFEVLENFGGFRVAAPDGNAPAPILTLDPGITFLMHPDTDIRIGTSSGRRGGLVANGTAAEPITFTRLDNTSTPWQSLRLELYSDTRVDLNHVTLAYGGAGTAVGMIHQLGSGALHLDHITATHSLSAGLYTRGGTANVNNGLFEANDTGLEFFVGSEAIIRNSTIRNNVTNGINVIDTGFNETCIDAVGNFWGSSDGPVDSYGDDDACGHGRTNNGSGDSVSGGVRYEPWLPVSGGLLDRGTIQPESFYVIADGVDSTELAITLRDVQGNPLAGKQVALSATAGTLQQPTEPTGENGMTTAVISSTTPGYAYVTAYNVTDDSPVSGIGGVTFWTGQGNAGGLISGNGSPFASPELIIGGKPYQAGFPVDMRVPMRNSNTVPVSVTVVYGVSGLNVGTRFAPVFTTTQTLQPDESWDAQAVWLPTSSGHRCIQASLMVDDGLLQQQALQDTFNTTLQQNTNQNPCNPDSLNPGNALPKTPRGGLGAVAKTFYNLYNLSKKANECLDSQLEFMTMGTSNGRDYQEIVTPPTFTPPTITADGDLTPDQADALNALAQTSADLLSLNLALGTTSQRLQEAAQAAQIAGAFGSDYQLSSRNVTNNDLVYLDLQYEAYRDFANQYAGKLDLFADQIDTLLAAVPTAGDAYYLPADFQTTRDELADSGFDADAESFYQQAGIPDDLIATLEGDLVAAFDRESSETIAFNLLLADIQNRSRTMATRLRSQYPAPNSAAHTAAGAPETIFVRPVVFDFEVGHPFDGTQTVDLVVRPVNLPVNWTYELSSPSYSMAEGETVKATLTLYPGSEMLEGALVQVAVEGYIDGDLVGGILMEHLTPQLTPRSATDVYLPLIVR